MGRSGYLMELGVVPGALRMGMVEASSDVAVLRSRIEAAFAPIRGTGRPPSDTHEPDALDLVDYGFHAHLWQVHRGRPVRVTNLCELVHIQWGSTRLPLEAVFALQRLGRGPATAAESWNGHEVRIDVPWEAIATQLLPLDGKPLLEGQSVSLSMDGLRDDVKLPAETHVGEAEAIFFGANDLELGMEDPELNPTAYQLHRALVDAEDRGRFEASTTEVLFSARDPAPRAGFHMICREHGEQSFWVKTRAGKKARWSWTQGDLASVLAKLDEPMRALAEATIDA